MEKVLFFLENAYKIKINDRTKELIEKILENPIYNEDDFIIACKNLYSDTRKKNIIIFFNSEIYSKYVNLRKEIVPVELKEDLTPEDLESLKGYYKIIVGRVGYQFVCKYNEMLMKRIKYFWKEKNVALWCIDGVLNNITNERNDIGDILNNMRDDKYFIDLCREQYRRANEYKKINPKIFDGLATNINEVMEGDKNGRAVFS